MNRLGVCRVAHEVEAAESLHREDPAFLQELDSIADRIIRFDGFARIFPEHELRTADRAGVRLSVETPVERITVLLQTLGAHFERRHRGLRAVVRQMPGDGEAGTAVRAVGERVTVATVAGREHIVRRDRGGDVPRFALMNGEGRIALQGNSAAQNRIDSGERRFGGTECRFKPQYSFSLPLNFDPDTGRVIKDEAGQMAFKRDPVNGGPETDPLYKTGYADKLSDYLRCFWHEKST